MTFQKGVSIFIIALLLNLVWENAHSVLYSHYQNGAISAFILFRASVVDAIIILFGIFLSRFCKDSRRVQFLMSFWLLIAIAIEWWALYSGRWAYAIVMPVIPFLKTGLTPTIQLVVTGFCTKFLLNIKEQYGQY